MWECYAIALLRIIYDALRKVRAARSWGEAVALVISGGSLLWPR